MTSAETYAERLDEVITYVRAIPVGVVFSQAQLSTLMEKLDRLSKVERQDSNGSTRVETPKIPAEVMTKGKHYNDDHSKRA